MSEAEGSGLYDAEYSDSDSDVESETGLSEESDSDSSDGSDNEEEEEDDDEFITEDSQIVDVQAASGISSDEGGEKESCPICLNRFIGQDLGIPESCDHIFCLECIKEWSKNINTCPIDRTEFNYVNLKSTPNGKILKKIKVKVLPKEPENALQQEVTVCEVCHHGDREDRLLLCDACDLAYHCECLDPPLFHVPIDEWFCPPCRTVLQNGAVAGPSTPRYRRVIPRTRASENVRTRVQDRRTRPAISRSPSTARKRTPQKRKRRVYRRGYKKVVTLARTKKNLMDGSKGKDCPRSTAVIVTYRKKRHKKRKKKTTKTSPASKSSARSVTKRISKHLGLVKSSKGGSIPDVKSKTKSTSNSVRPSGSSHFLFGDKNQLMDFDESFLEDSPGPSRRQQEEISQQSSSSSINILDSIIAGQKILHTKSNDVIIKTDGSLVLKENKTKEKGTFKKPIVCGKTKGEETIKKPNACDRMSKTGTIKKSNVYDKTKDKGKEIIKKPDANNKVKSGHATFGELSDLGAIPKSEKSSDRKPSPMLLAALARRRENEMSNQSVSDYKCRSPIERTETSSGNHQHSSLLNLSDQKQSSFDLKSKMLKSSSSFEAMNKSSGYSHEAPLKKSGKTGSIKSNFDNFQNPREFNSSSDYQSFACSNLNTSGFKYETNDKKSLFKSENGEKSPKHCHSTKQRLNNFSGFLGVTHSASYEGNTFTRQSNIKNENVSSNGHAKKMEIPKYIKKEPNDLLSDKSIVSMSGINATMIISSETDINDDDEDTMDSPPSSQSLIQSNPGDLLTSFCGVRQEILAIKKEPDSTLKNHFTEKSDSECSQSLVEPLNEQLRSKSQSPRKSLGKKVNDFKLKIKKLLESSDDDCQSPDKESNNSSIQSHRQVMDDNEDDTLDFEESQSIITQTFTEITTKNGQTNRKRPKQEINSSDDETYIPQVSKAYSQSKPMNKLRNDKNVSEDFSKIKIKEELLSSEDEGGESSSLLTGDLPFAQLAEKSNLSCTYLKNSTFNSTQRISSHFNEKVNDLPCTQLVETTCNEKDESPFTPSSKSPFNKPEDDLPSTQLVEILDEQKDDLPCTQLVKSESVKFQHNKAYDLPDIQSASPVSNRQMDDLPCTQLVEPSLVRSVSNEEEHVLPCTQLARPVSSIYMENLLCTQLVRPLPSMHMEDLSCTQFAAPLSMKYLSKKKEDTLPATQPSNPFSEMQIDDLLYTHLVESSSSEKEDTLPCTQLARPVSNLEMEDLPCTQLARPQSSMQMNDLSCKQFVVPASVKYPFKKKEDALFGTQPSSCLSNMEVNDLPCTQFALPVPVKSLSKKKGDALPSTQPPSPFSEMQMDDLPCTQLGEPLSKSVSNEDDALPCTQLVRPVSNEDDALPCTQLAIPVSNMEMEDLPCTQLAGPVASMGMDDFPCTQLARPLSSNEMNDLPCKQFVVPASVKYSFKKGEDALFGTQPSSRLSDMEVNDIPCTQFALPAPVKSISKKKGDTLPSTQPSTPSSEMQMDDLPCTQLVEPLSKPVSNEEEDALPCTQLARPVSNMEMEDLPCTQLAGPFSSMGVDNLPCTQLARPLSSMQMTDLSCNQFVAPASVKHSFKKEEVALPPTQPSSPFSEMQMEDLPCTQLVETLSKCIPNEEKEALPCTQLAIPVSSTEMEDLPGTQLARSQSCIQMDDVPSTQFVVPASVKYPLNKGEDALPSTQPFDQFSNMEMCDLPCTQFVKPRSLSNKVNDTLLSTQLATSVSSFHSGESPQDYLNHNTYVQSKGLPAHGVKISSDSNTQAKHEHSDSFREVKNSHGNPFTTQPNANIENSTKNSENLSSNLDDDFDLPETQPLTFDQHHSKSMNLLLEKCNNEHVTDQELISIIDKLKIKKPPAKKVVGVHKNLPQVLMSIPTRRIPVPKPSNRKTFSFDQVKQQCDTRDDKDDHGRKLVVTKMGDLSSKLTLSSVLKEEQQVSSKCKDGNPNNFNHEKSTVPLFVNENKISISSLHDCDLKVEMDKNSKPPDSEIEIINDNEIMRLKKVEEVVLSSDEEDLPATQFVVRPSNQCSDVPKQRKIENLCVPIKRELNDCFEILSETQQHNVVEKSADIVNVCGNVLEKVVVKKEHLHHEVENEKAIDSLSVKQEKCEESILNKIKKESLQQLETEGQVCRLIKGKTKSHDFEDITDVRNIQCADKYTNQKASNTKDSVYNNNDSRYIRGHEKYDREKKIKTDIIDFDKKKVRDRSNSSEEKLNFEKEKKNKRKNSSEIGIHSDAENKTKTKTESRSLSKTSSNSKIKVNTESVKDLKLVSKDKKPKTDHVSSSHSHTKGEHIKNHELSVEKRKSSSKEDNYHEDSKRRKLNKLDDSKKKLVHKVDTLTIKNEPTTNKNRKHDFDKSLDNTKETHKLKNNIKIEHSTRQESYKPSVKANKMSNSGKTKETHINNNEKSRHDKKTAKVHCQTIESKNSSKSSSVVNSNVPQSSSHDKKINCKNINSENKNKEFGNIPFNNKEKLNGRIKGESNSEKKVKNQLKESKTNFKDESTKTSRVLKRYDSFEGERKAKRSYLENLSCNEDTSDCHSDYSRSSEISSESNFRKKYNHQRNALNALNEIADEIISASKNCKTGISNQNENMDLEVTKRSKDPASVGRKVDKAHLKDEIAAEVKLALKPFYTMGLIDKDDYKDIMRKAVPKIFMNCGNFVNPEKIKNLVTSYVKRLTNS